MPIIRHTNRGAHSGASVTCWAAFCGEQEQDRNDGDRQRVPRQLAQLEPGAATIGLTSARHYVKR